MKRFNQTLATGTQLGAYTIIRQLGQGGMGEVYEALDERLQRRVVIKIIAKHEYNDPDERALQNFLREAHALGRINHPNVVTVYGVDKFNGIDYIVMERIPGADLRSILKHHIFTSAEALPLLLQMLEGLKVLHDIGILHRDLKPANLMLRPNGQIKLLDFGVAKFIDDANPDKTVTMVFEGTLLYTAPELAAGAAASKQSDLWNLGAIFFECMVGRKMIETPDADNFLLSLEYVKKVEPKIPPECEAWIPKPVRQILERLCANSPGDRYASAQEAIREIKAYLAAKEIPPERFYRTVTRSLGNADEVRARIEARGFSISQGKRILTLSALLEAEQNPGAELSFSDSLRLDASEDLDISASSIDQSIVRFTDGQLGLTLPRAKNVLHLTPKHIARVVACGVVLVALVGVVSYQLAHRGRRAPAAAKLDNRVHRHNEFSLILPTSLDARLQAELGESFDRQVDIVEAANLRPPFMHYLKRQISIEVAPDQVEPYTVPSLQTIRLGAQPTDPKNPVLLKAVLFVFASLAKAEVLNRQHMVAYFMAARARQLVDLASLGVENPREYFALAAVTHLYGNSGVTGFDASTLKTLNPDYAAFIDSAVHGPSAGEQ